MYDFPFFSFKLQFAVGSDVNFKVFGPSSGFNIGFIMAEEPQSNGDRERPLETVTPLAQELGLTVDDSWYISLFSLF